MVLHKSRGFFLSSSSLTSCIGKRVFIRESCTLIAGVESGQWFFWCHADGRSLVAGRTRREIRELITPQWIWQSALSVVTLPGLVCITDFVFVSDITRSFH